MIRGTLVWDFPRKAFVFQISGSGARPESIQRVVGSLEFAASYPGVIIHARRRFGRLLVTVTGPAVDHLYQAFPLHGLRGAQVLTSEQVDAMRQRLDENRGTSTNMFVRDIGKLVHDLAS